MSKSAISQGKPREELDLSGATYVPGYITIVDVTQDSLSDAEYVISNEASGKHFMANEATANFITALRDRGSIQEALSYSRLDPQRAGPLLKQLIDMGFIVDYGQTKASNAAPKAPIESKMVSLRWDILDIGAVVRRFSWIGRLFYSRLGYAVWCLGLGVMIFQLLTNADKVRLTMSQALEASMAQWMIFAALYVGLKIVHEMGHAMAFRQMSAQEGLDEGPIRVGLAIFAFTPFPFTDVTSAWRIKSRWRRMMIGLGGIYFETWAMIVLTLIWAQTQTGLFQTVILQVTVVAGAMTLLFNLNPAVKLDGYFVMTDFFRAPNLAGKAGYAARSTAARALGADLPKPRFYELAYWVISYLYRWTIFAGIFWLIYQFDARLAPVALGLVVMTLLVRPIINTLKFARKSGVRFVKTVLTVTALGALAVGLFIPFDRYVSVPGTIMLYDTRFVEAPEAGMLSLSGTRLDIDSRDLDQRATETALQQVKLENLQRASFASAEQQASLSAELASYRDIAKQLEDRRTNLQLSVENARPLTWSLRSARERQGSWIDPAMGHILGALSDPTAPYLSLRVAQNVLSSDMKIASGTAVQARLMRQPECLFETRIDAQQSLSVAQDDIVKIRSLIDLDAMACRDALVHGSPVLARFFAGQASLVDRFWLYAARTLQDRLLLNAK